jgi:hypothetical protein
MADARHPWQINAEDGIFLHRVTGWPAIGFTRDGQFVFVAIEPIAAALERDPVFARRQTCVSLDRSRGKP